MFHRVSKPLVRALLLALPLALAACGGEGFDEEGEALEEVDEVGEVALAIKAGDKFRVNLGQINFWQGLQCAAQAGRDLSMEVGNCTIDYTTTYCRPQYIEGVYSCVCDAQVTGTSGQGCGQIEVDDIGI